VNFILEEPTQVRYIDATMALHNAGALYLVSNKSLERGLVFPPAEMETKLFDVMRANGCISDELDLL
jgi:adenosylhomocysteinase